MPGDRLWSSAPPAEDDDDLRLSLTRLSQLATSTLTLPETLTHVARLAVQAIPRADGVVLTLLQKRGPDATAYTSELVREVDAVQNALDEGPAVTAVAEEVTVSSGSLGGDIRWPRFGPRVGRLNVHSALAVPLRTPDTTLGALTVFASSKNAFDARAAELGELFGRPATISIQNARALADALQLTRQLEAALTNRAVIDHSIGILISRSGCTPSEAFGKLRVVSQTESKKVADVAQSIVDDAARRARARQCGD